MAEEKKYASKEVLDEIERRSDALKKAILESPADVRITGTTYYVDSEGNDDNDGKSPATAWKTIAKVASFPFAYGDAVLFKRGCEFRGKGIRTRNGVTYSAYGEGTKPLLNGSAMNYAADAEWTEVEDYPNVYRCSVKVNDAGIMAFDHEKYPGYYDGVVGIKKNPDEIVRFTDAEPFHGIEDLDENGEFYNDYNEKWLYLYCDKGNPSDVYKSIEIGDRGNIISCGETDVVIDNLFLMYTGSHGIGCGGVHNLVIQNCIIGWIGGSILGGYGGANSTRYGNAIEVYGACEGYHVYNNWIYQIYDTGITHQYSGGSPDDNLMIDVEYKNNLIDLCNWSIEYYNNDDGLGGKRLVKDVHIHDNICRDAGFGWGEQRPDKCATHCNSFGITQNTENNVIENNIFCRSNYYLVRVCEGGDRKAQYRHNTYVQYDNRMLGYIFEKNYAYSDVYETIESLYHETDPVIYYIHE